MFVGKILELKTRAGKPCYSNHGESKADNETFWILSDCDPDTALLFRYNPYINDWVLEYDFAASNDLSTLVPFPAKLGSGHTLHIGTNYIWILLQVKNTANNSGAFIPMRILARTELAPLARS